MTKTEQLIIQSLRQELEQHDPDTDYSQWLLAVAVTATAAPKQPTHIARVILATSSSPYVDGTDIQLTVDLKQGTADCERWAHIWAEAEPQFHGGTVQSALQWLLQHADPCYLQLENPHPKYKLANFLKKPASQKMP